MRKLKSLLSFLLCVAIMMSTIGCTKEREHEHKGVHRSAIESTCTSLGKVEHWQCVICDKLFADEDCTEEIDTFVEPQKPHTLTRHAEKLATETESGNIEYWTCDVCNKFFSDENGKSEISEKDTALYSLASLVDFIVEVPADRDPIILQLADPQLMDSASKPLENASSNAYWTFEDESSAKAGVKGKNALCYDFITEIIEKTKENHNGALDLILITGDVIYGSYDNDGHMLADFVNFMETFDIPWAPIMGNHDVEGDIGADWICEQYENAPNCLFEQGDLKGNGNYTIGIKQNDELKRVFFNMDTNGCTGASTNSTSNGHTVTKNNNDYDGKDIGTYGLQQDQVKWFNETAESIKTFVPSVKISLHIHIPMKYFYVAYNEAYKTLLETDYVAKVVVGGNGNAVFNGVNTTGRVLYPERVVGHKEGDFGFLTTLYQDINFTPDFWDDALTNDAIPGATGDHAIFKQIKAAGTDSIFVGHWHSNSASIVYDGIRFQYGQKCSLYDSVPLMLSDGSIISRGAGYGIPMGSTLLIGGSVIPLDKYTGDILTPYTQYCEGFGAEINWGALKNTIGTVA